MDIAESIIIFVLCFVIVVIPTAFLFIETFEILPFTSRKASRQI